ncbi:Coenzyme F420 hydrogenase/dehydrogenase, beta subunit C-terminal domain [Geminicoccus harenae]|uniref:Coenzyme F420 hydrogenase/dehydrogenase, beta subunit C-terminal domain n=1 Tax=Geminicoccus harenae TaxID=2498453 RepID=UPI00168A4627|nr:Coenzyme F420 hydrogenase/dehydrogenase, beta subunit C-terminal domain [Geminicoccus harenae]
MKLNDSGFLRPMPSGPLTENEEHIVQEVCSGAELTHRTYGRSYHPLWGPLVRTRTGFANDSEVRFSGSSGGVLSALLIYLLDHKLVDFVLHVAADSRDPFGNAVRPSRSRQEVLEAAGSRYAPSTTLADMEQYLASGATFAVVGKPCDIASLRRMGQRDSRVLRQVRYMFSFMCAGVPSRNGTLAVIDELGARADDVIAFAYRGQGWPGSARATLRDGSERRMSYRNSWGRILSRHLQFRCKICPDGTAEFADIVCGDAWYGKDGYPDFEERDGRSLILTRTREGEALLQAAVDACAITVTGFDVAEIEKIQPYQAHRKQVVLARVLALRLLGRPSPRYLGLELLKLSRSAGVRALLQGFLGTMRRVLRAQAVG